MDDLLAIVIIAVFYAEALAVLPLVLAVDPLGLFAVLVQRRVRSWWLLLPLALATWVLIHASGVNATVAGVAARVHRARRTSLERPVAFGEGERNAHVRLAVLLGSTIAALLAAAVLRVRNRQYRR